MATKAVPSDPKTTDTGGPVEPGYSDWKRNKVARGLEQAKDRESMVPAERVWRNLGLER